MIFAATQEAGDMGRGQTDEGYGAAEGGGDGGEDACGAKEEGAYVGDTESEVLGILIAKEKGVEGFYHHQGQEESGYRWNDEIWELLKGDSGKTAPAPDYVGEEVVAGGKDVEQTDK